MSKSYNNTIPLFAEEKKLRKLIMKIKTNSQAPEEPKNPEECTLFQIYRAFATPAESAALRERYARGIGWGEMKQLLFEYLNNLLKEPRRRYEELLDNPRYIENVLRAGAAKARRYSQPFLERLRAAIGIQPVG
jgi:tryptophanyl-tRNA synthetase